ncbi:MAG: outer membrane beta-barrel protein [Bacteroidales bacterium]
MKPRSLYLRILPVVVACLLLQVATAQKNFQPGYIVDLAGDTTYGFIDNRDWDVNPQSVTFSPTAGEGGREFSPLEIHSFGTADTRYTGAVVQLEISLRTTSELKSDPSLKLRQDTLFLETIVLGPKSLYAAKLRYSSDNYYIENNGEYQLLEYKKYFRMTDKKRMIAENKKYIGQLIVYLDNCPQITQKINNVRYEMGGLRKLFLSWYDCMQSAPGFQSPVEKLKFRWGAVAGATISNLFASGNVPSQLPEVDFPSSVDPTAGFCLDVVLPKAQQKWSIYNELIYTTYTFESSWSEYMHEDYFKNINFTLSFGYIRLNNAVRYSMPVGKNVFVFLNAGVSNGVVVNSTNVKKEHSRFYSTEKYEENMAIDAKKHEIGYLVGAGLKYGRFSLESRYEFSNGLSGLVNFQANVRRIYFMAGYRF